jgi:hypothetical protein
MCFKGATAVQGVLATLFGGCKGSAAANQTNSVVLQTGSGYIIIDTNASVNSNNVYYLYFTIGTQLSANIANKLKVIPITYTGNGTAGRTLTGLGYNLGTAPDAVVIIKGAGTQYPVFRTSQHYAGCCSYFLYPAADLLTGITGFTTDGFSIGSNATVNTNGVTYSGYVLVANTDLTPTEIVTGAYQSCASAVSFFVPSTGAFDSCLGFFIPDGANNCIMHWTHSETQFIQISPAAAPLTSVGASYWDAANKLLTIATNTEINVEDVKVHYCLLGVNSTDAKILS